MQSVEYDVAVDRLHANAALPELPAPRRNTHVQLNNGDVMGRLAVLGDFWDFLKVRKKLWLAPILIVLGLLSFLIVLTQGSALAPFIYALF